MYETIARPPKIYRLAPAPLPRPSGLNARVIADALRRRPSAIFTDIDGTLCPIVATPSEATVREECREALRALTLYVDLLCVLSGRPADEAWRMVRIDEALYVGNHGAERWFRGELLRPPGIERYHARLARAHAMLRLSLANVPGLVFEDKGIGFAVHFRREPAVGPEVLRVARSVAARRGLEVVERTAHVEVRPPSSEDKGSSLLALARHYGLRGLIVLGDDRVDLPAFAAARAHASETGCTAVVVGVGDAFDDELDVDISLARPSETCALLSSVVEILRS
ncbi:MAG: trehalose-phosphatase [Chloroflexota bacterium]